MHDGAVLDVGIGADADRRDVAAQHAAEPDIGMGVYLGIADDHGCRGQPGLAGNPRRGAPERQDDGAAHGKSGSCSNPVVSAMPSMAFMSCTAWPEAPFTRLSITETRMARPDKRSCAKPIWQRLDPRT